MQEDRDEELDTPHPLTDDQIRALRENGHVRLQVVFSPELLAAYEREITTLVGRDNQNILPMEERGSYAPAFIQISNLSKKNDVMKRFSTNRRCAEIATRLLGCTGVRLWHDQALYKEPGGGITAWHCDQFFRPMASERSLTAWIPLQATPAEMGPLYFADRSHLDDCGRDLGISDEGEERIGAALRRGRDSLESSPLCLATKMCGAEIEFGLPSRTRDPDRRKPRRRRPRGREGNRRIAENVTSASGRTELRNYGCRLFRACSGFPVRHSTNVLHSVGRELRCGQS